VTEPRAARALQSPAQIGPALQSLSSHRPVTTHTPPDLRKRARVTVVTVVTLNSNSFEGHPTLPTRQNTPRHPHLVQPTPITVPEDTITTPTTAPVPVHKLLLTAEDAAERLGIGRTTMFALIRSGAVESVLIGRLRRIRVADLERYINHLTVAEAA